MNVYKQFGNARLDAPHGFVLDESQVQGVHEVFVKCLCDWQAIHHFPLSVGEQEKFTALEQDVRQHNRSAGGDFGSS